MYHGRAKRRFNRTAEHRQAMFANMAQALIKHEQMLVFENNVERNVFAFECRRFRRRNM